MRYELGSYSPEDAILHSHGCENRKSYMALTGWDLQRRSNVSPVRYELGYYIPEDGNLHSQGRENLKSCMNFYHYILYPVLKLYGRFGKVYLRPVSAFLQNLMQHAMNSLRNWA
jgi:hypothetical protein